MKNSRNKFRERPKGRYLEVYVYPDADNVSIYTPPARPGNGQPQYSHRFSTSTPAFFEYMKRWEWWKVDGTTYVRVR